MAKLTKEKKARLMDLITDSGRLKTCKDEWKERTSKYLEKPLLSPDMEPPVDLPWPEYVTTQRGSEWHIPPFKV